MGDGIEWMSIAQVAVSLGVSRSRVHQLRTEGRFGTGTIRVGRQWALDPADVLRVGVELQDWRDLEARHRGVDPTVQP